MKLKSADETETYISDAGYYVIKQTQAMGDEVSVCLTPAQVDLIIKDMQECMKDDSWHSEKIEE